MRLVLRYLFAAGLLWQTSPAHAEVMRVAADIWCPFNCQPDAPLPGYIIEVLAAVFPRQSIDYQVLPWKRAMLQARQGTSTAALAATALMAREEQLLIGRQPVGHAHDCLYVAPGSSQVYRGQAADLDGLQRVGIALGYEYTEGLGAWLAENKPRVFTESGDEPARRNLRKLMHGGLDGMIEDRSVMNFLLLDPAYAGRVRLAGCNQPVPLYMAFSPTRPGAAGLPERFDQGLQALRKSGRLARILDKYGVTDWQP